MGLHYIIMVQYTSRKANRADLWFDIPNYTTLMSKIREVNACVVPEYQSMRHKDMHKALLSVFMLTGARVTEVIDMRRRNITFLKYDGSEIIDYNEPFIKVSDVFTMVFTLRNEKNKTHPIKKIPVMRNPLWGETFGWFIEWYNTLPAKADAKVFPICRSTVWRLFKCAFGKNYFPHIMRHYVTSNDTSAGVHPMIVKQKLGWSSLRMYDTYAHMNTDDIKREFIRVYGVTPQEKVNLDITSGKTMAFNDVINQLGKDKRQLNTSERTLVMKRHQEQVKVMKNNVEDAIMLV